LAHKKYIYKQCNAEPESAECKFGKKLRAKNEAKRIADGYYKMSKEDRDKADAAESAGKAEALKELNAAAKPKPPAGPTVGSSCVKNEAGVRAACAEGHCCGKATKGLFGADGSKDSICDVKTNTKHTVKAGDVTEEWDFKCITGAK